jgi:drug/metabolite transporter (DMT)-like permease
MSPVRRRAYAELLVVAIIWGVAAVIIKYTLQGFSPLIFLTYRFFISTVIAIIFFLTIGFKPPKDRKTFIITLFNGFLISTVSLGLLFLGTNETTSINTNLISAITPILVAVAGVFFLNEKVTKRESIGILIALTGTVITIIGPSLAGSKINFFGNLLVFTSVIVTVATAVFAKIVLRNKVDPLFATNISFVVGFITLVPFAARQLIASNLEIITSVPLKYQLGVFYMALLSGTLGYYLWHKAEKSIEIGEVNLITYLYPIFGTPLSILWLKEKVTPFFLVGSIVIAIGVLLAELKKPRKIV